jgi:hypothetical protein
MSKYSEIDFLCQQIKASKMLFYCYTRSCTNIRNKRLNIGYFYPFVADEEYRGIPIKKLFFKKSSAPDLKAGILEPALKLLCIHPPLHGWDFRQNEIK